MQKNFLPLLGLFLCLSTAFGQSESSPHALAIRKTIIDYYTPTYGAIAPASELKGGVEMTYYRQLAGSFYAGFPLKMGLVKMPEETKNRSNVSLDALLVFEPSNMRRTLSPYLFGGIGISNEAPTTRNAALQVPMGIGLNVKLASVVSFSLQSEFRSGLDDQNTSLHHAIGLRFSMGGEKPFRKQKAIREKDLKDTDGDGVFDQDDLCPHQPGPRIFRGCPDTDGDGIPDQEDRCPDDPGLPMANGCPDIDRDGVSDFLDECPGIAGTANGCPDADGDGVSDKDDNCPDFAGTGPDGCGPVDLDGLQDVFVAKGFEVPLTESETIVLNQALDNISFEWGKARLTVSSLFHLDQVLAVMAQNPTYRLEVVGHADNTGSSARNLQLSEERARACYTYLVKKGADPTRIFFKGEGESTPIATNLSEEGRQINRRVEFYLY